MKNHLYQKTQVAQSFSKAAFTYDSAALLQKQTGYLLLEKLSEIPSQPKNLLDMGSGTGYFTQKIAHQYPKSQVIGVDIALGMTHFSTQNHSHPNISYLCADADHLPFKNHQIDAIFSNLMLQWSSDLLNTLKSFKRILKPEGYLFFSTLAGNTLFELKQAWKAVDPHPHVHPFLQYEEIIQYLNEAGYEIHHIQQSKTCFYYKHLLDLFSNLKSLGAHNLQSTRAKGLSGKKTLIQLTQAYEEFRQDHHELPATYEVIYGIVK